MKFLVAMTAFSLVAFLPAANSCHTDASIKEFTDEANKTKTLHTLFRINNNDAPSSIAGRTLYEGELMAPALIKKITSIKETGDLVIFYCARGGKGVNGYEIANELANAQIPVYIIELPDSSGVHGEKTFFVNSKPKTQEKKDYDASIKYIEKQLSSNPLVTISYLFDEAFANSCGITANDALSGIDVNVIGRNWHKLQGKLQDRFNSFLIAKRPIAVIDAGFSDGLVSTNPAVVPFYLIQHLADLEAEEVPVFTLDNPAHLGRDGALITTLKVYEADGSIIDKPLNKHQPDAIFQVFERESTQIAKNNNTLTGEVIRCGFANYIEKINKLEPNLKSKLVDSAVN